MRRVAGAFLLAVFFVAPAQGAIWRNGWYADGQPTALWGTSTAVATTTGQFVVLEETYGWGYQLTSMTPGGAINWQVNFADFVDGEQLVAGPDGSVFVGALRTMTRVDASGNVVWSRNDLNARGFIFSAGAVYAENCSALARLDADTGATQWIAARANAKNCNSGVGTDAAGNVYLISQVTDPPTTPIPPVRLAKFDSAGSVQWDIAITATGMGAQWLGAADGRAFVEQGHDVAAYDTASGAPLWTHAQMTGLLIGGTPASPVAVDYAGTHRLDPVDGHVDWTIVTVQSPPSAVQGAAAYFCSFYYVSKIDATTGSADWNFSLAPNSNSCFALALDGGNVLAASIDNATASIRIDTIDASGGTAVASSLAAPTQQGLVDSDSFVDQGRIVQAGKILGSTDCRLRSIDAASGSVDWDVAFSPPLTGDGPLLGRSADSIIVTDSTAYGNGYAADYWIGSFARADGSLRWSVVNQVVSLSNQADVWGSAPLTDSHGDVFVSYWSSGACSMNPTQTCYTATVMKLAAADGSVLWHFDSVSGGDFDAPPFTLIGDDVLVAGYLKDAIAGKNIARLSGSDGSVMWSAAPFPGETSQGVLVNPDGTITLTSTSSRALLQAIGSVVWTDHPTQSCFTQCLVYGSAQLADGTFIYAGTDFDTRYSNQGFLVSQPLVQNAPSHRVPVNSDAPADVRSWPLQVVVDGANVWTTGEMKQAPYTYFYYLAKLDPATLALSDEQVLTSTGADAFAAGSSFSMLAPPAGNLLPADTNTWGDGAPATSGAALFDTTITARGDLSLTMTGTDTANVSTFKATVTYAGDASITGARFTLWRGGFDDASGLSCATSNASNCVVSNRSGYVVVTFDVAPGGSVTVSGQYSAAPLTMYGSVAGPGSLAEPSLGNNFASFPLPNDFIFRNAFE